MGQLEKEKKAPQPIVVVVVVAMSKGVELEAFDHEHVLEETDLHVLEEREIRSFQFWKRDRKL